MLREDAQGFGWVLCQLTLTRIPRQFSRARIEFLRRECYEELEQGRTLPCPQKS